MSQPDLPDDDLVGDLLNIEGPTDVDRLRLPLLTRTARVVRRRRVIRRLGLAAGLAGCYLAGIVTVWGWVAASIPRDSTVIEQHAAPEAKPDEGSLPAPERPRSPEVPRPRPAQLGDGRQVVAARADFGQIRRVSDRYLYEEGDIVKALHYYTRALDQASPEEREISPETDSWLLMALKEARKKERSDENGGT